MDDLRRTVDLARRGSAEAAGALFERCWPVAWRASYTVIGDAALAEDAAQDAIVAVFRSLRRFDPTLPLEPWVRKIAVNAAIDTLRREQRARSAAAPVEARSAGEENAHVRESFIGLDKTWAKMSADAAAAGHVMEGWYSKVISDQAVGLEAIGTANGPIRLWIAPTEDGRQCWLIQTGQDKATGQPTGLSSCDESEPKIPIRFESFWTDERPDVKIVHIRVYDDGVTTVGVAVDSGHDLALPVASGNALGWIPKSARVTDVVAHDASGAVVARFTP
jgi:RNA polymerase sigma factor (sigma-70 family)